MTTEATFSAEEKNYIIDHMNDDHSDACLLYVQHYCEIADAEDATLIDVDARSMMLEYTRNGATERITYEFQNPLQSVMHAAKVMADMVYDVEGQSEGQSEGKQ